MPFLHEFKLAGNYLLRYGVDVGAVLQSYPGLERVITWQPAATLFPNGQRTAGADDRAQRTGIALSANGGISST